ncbi:MAG: hypothetical protein ACOCSE_01565 [Chitinivibrionales bacterium]
MGSFLRSALILFAVFIHCSIEEEYEDLHDPESFELQPLRVHRDLIRRREASLSYIGVINTILTENRLKRENDKIRLYRRVYQFDSAVIRHMFPEPPPQERDLIITFLMEESGHRDSFHISSDTASLFIGEIGDMFKLSSLPTKRLPLLDSLKEMIESIPHGKYTVDSDKKIFFKIVYGNKEIICYGCHSEDRVHEPMLARILLIVAKSFQKVYREIK